MTKTNDRNGKPNKADKWVPDQIEWTAEPPTMMKGASNDKGEYYRLVQKCLEDAERFYAETEKWSDKWYIIGRFRVHSTAGTLSRSLQYAGDPDKVDKSRHNLPTGYVLESGVKKVENSLPYEVRFQVVGRR